VNKTKLSVLYDDVLPKVNVIKKKQVIVDGTLTHLSKERKKLEFLKDNEHSNSNCAKDESQTENK
jgi:malonyl CoA-acyl carrier protein transacylase